MKRLWVAAALAPLSFAASAQAQTTISNGTSTPVSTSGAGGDVTIVSGGSITPTTAGTAAAPVAAVTINSSNKSVTTGTTTTQAGGNVSNAGGISFTGLNYTTGILAQGGFTGSITNTGTITNSESTSYKDTNNDNISDTNGSNPIGVNLFASGTNRFGIATAGTAAFTGDINNSGTITILGENSAAISIGSGGLNGNLIQSGTLSVTGGNPNTADISYGIVSTGQIAGNVTLSGTINAVGQNATAVSLAHVTGQLEVYGSLTATGYEATSPIATTSLQAELQTQAAEELLQGGPALQITGSVNGGISLSAAITGSVTGSSTTTAVAGAVITSYGSAPAVLIGGATPITIGAIASSATSAQVTASGQAAKGFAGAGYGLVVGGSVTGEGLYVLNNTLAPVNATGLSIGSTIAGNNSAGAVTLNGGIDISGTVEATTTGAQVDTKSGDIPTGNATALLINNATVNANATTNSAVDITGTVLAQTSSQTTFQAAVAASGSKAATAEIDPPSATAILFGSNAHVGSITNAGVVDAAVGGLSTSVITSGGGTQGFATAIRDLSGSLTSVTNENTISATVTPINALDLVDPTHSSTVAIDLSHNTTQASVTQALASTPVTAIDSSTGLTTTVIPTIRGDVLFGSGTNSLNLQTGDLAGGISFAAGSTNSITITGGAIALGPLAEGKGGSLSIDVENGLLGISAPTTTTLDSTLHQAAATGYNGNANNPQTTIGVSNIKIGANGQLVLSVFAPPTNASAASSLATVGAPQLNVSGTVTIASGGDIGLNFLTKLNSSATYDIIEAGKGQISIANTATALGALPYIYTGSLSTTALDSTHDAITITVAQKTAAQLGLNAAQAAAYNAFYAAFGANETCGDTSSKALSGNCVGSVLDTVLTQTTKAGFDHLYNQFLPDYSGGPFGTLVMGQDALASAETDAPTKLNADGQRGWVQEIGFSETRSSSGVVGYEGKGFGFTGGTETVHGDSATGVAFAIMSTSIGDTGRPVGSSQTATTVEGGLYWREGGDGLNLGASVNGGWAFLQSHRDLLEQSGSNNATFFREAKANWNGAIGSSELSIAYKANLGRFFIKPEAMAEYVMLYESGYTEAGAGNAVDLTVNSKLNQEGLVQADTVFGASFGDAIRWTPSLTLGWRQIVTGGPSNTQAHFQGGQSFTLSPDFQDKGGLLARLGLRASGNFADFSANAGGVFRTGYDSVDARATARFLF